MIYVPFYFVPKKGNKWSGRDLFPLLCPPRPIPAEGVYYLFTKIPLSCAR